MVFVRGDHQTTLALSFARAAGGPILARIIAYAAWAAITASAPMNSKLENKTGRKIVQHAEQLVSYRFIEAARLKGS